jgi:hypothetical protein
MFALEGDEKRLLARALTRSAVDVAFRKWLLTEPHAAVAEATGLVLPSTFRIAFIEPPRDIDALIVLPPLIEPAPVAPTKDD